MNKNGEATINKSAVLDERQNSFSIDTSLPFKLNAGTTGFCECWFVLATAKLSGYICTDRVLYTPERLAKIAAEAAKDSSYFSLNDRIGLVHDAVALSKAGFAKVSSALTLVNILHNEKQCESISSFLRQYDY